MDIDFPEILVDIKTTSAKKPQSSAPFKHARQRVYGLGYSLLIFVYRKTDDGMSRTSLLEFRDVVYVDASHTADHRLTKAINASLDAGVAEDGIFDLLVKTKNLEGVDASILHSLTIEIIQKRPPMGAVTLSNALQWRLSYAGAIKIAKAGSRDGLEAL